jgi:hypothetical protein
LLDIPWGCHLTDVLLHAATAIALFLVLRAMTDRLWPSALVAALFAAHPLRAESVAWVTERKDVLSGLFFMLTLAAYVGYARRRFSLVRYLAVLLLLGLGLMAKPMLVMLPLVLLLLDYWPLGRIAAGTRSAPAVACPRKAPDAGAGGRVACALVGWRKYPYVSVGWLWYLGMLVPVIALVQVTNQAMTNRFTYLPQIGIAMALVWGSCPTMPTLATTFAACWPTSWSAIRRL